MGSKTETLRKGLNSKIIDLAKMPAWLEGGVGGMNHVPNPWMRAYKIVEGGSVHEKWLLKMVIYSPTRTPYSWKSPYMVEIRAHLDERSVEMV